MSWHFSLALVEEFSDLNCLNTESYVQLRSIRTAERSCFDGKTTRSYRRSLSGMTYAPSTATRGVEKWMLSLVVSPVSLGAKPESGKGGPMSVTSGLTRSELSGRWDHNTVSWKMYPASSRKRTSERSSAGWPRRGTMFAGILFQRPKRVPTTSGRGSGLLPTPSATGYGTNQGGSAGRTGKVRPSLQQMASKNLWPSPTANRRSGLQSHGKNAILGPLNPMWVEWLMGWPLGWTDLKPLEMDKYREWLAQHS